jgi:hypothetical protein
MANGLATFFGVILGIPTALLVERWMEQRRNNKYKVLNKIRIEDLLYRTMIQVANIESSIKTAQTSVDNNFLIFVSFPQVEVIETLHKLLTELETDWEVLLSLDFIISDTKSLVSLLEMFREMFSLLMLGKISPLGRYSVEFKKEIEFRELLSLEAISDFREKVMERYPEYIKHIDS